MAGTIHQAMAYLGLTAEQEEPQSARRRERSLAAKQEDYLDYDEDFYYEDVVEDTGYSRSDVAALRSDILEQEGQAQDAYSSDSNYQTHEEVAKPISASASSESSASTYSAAATNQTPRLQTSSAGSQNTDYESEDSLRQITTIHPRSYNDAKIIGESFRENIPVIMNVTEMGEAEAKRLVDFSAGLAFALRGSIERVTDKVFLLTPVNLEVLAPEGVETPIALDVDQNNLFNQG